MFTHFFSTTRVAYIACQISARHTLERRPSALAYHHPLEQTLFDNLNSSSSGVFVHWGVYQSGKSTAVREVAWRLQEEAGRQVVFLHHYDFSWIRPRSAWLRRAIGVPKDMIHEPISKFFVRLETTIVIDHFCMRDDNMEEDLELVHELIKESEETQHFNVLFVLDSWERAKELVDAGCKLVPGDAPARWTGDQLDTLFATLPDKLQSKVGENKEELLRLATLSGAPGFLTFEAQAERVYDWRHAAMHDLEWRKGTKAIYQHSLLLAHSCMEEGPGRFPDKNGIFHHEDLAALKPSPA